MSLSKRITRDALSIYLDIFDILTFQFFKSSIKLHKSSNEYKDNVFYFQQQKTKKFEFNIRFVLSVDIAPSRSVCSLCINFAQKKLAFNIVLRIFPSVCTHDDLYFEISLNKKRNDSGGTFE